MQLIINAYYHSFILLNPYMSFKRVILGLERDILYKNKE